MYGGELGERIVSFLAANGGMLRNSDFAAQRSEWVDPISVNYRGVEVYELPPNSQGVALLEMLLMLDESDLGAVGQHSAELVHQLVERKKLAFADRDAYVADPRHVEVPLHEMLDPLRARMRAETIGSGATPSLAQTVGRAGGGDTIYLCAADRDGNVVSLIQSLFAGFGSGVHVPGTGVTLHNRGSGFTLADGHPNQLAPGKRPMHTLMPGFAMRDGRPWLAFGTRGATASHRRARRSGHGHPTDDPDRSVERLLRRRDRPTRRRRRTRWLARSRSAVERQGDARDEGRGITAQPRYGFGHLLRRADTPHGLHFC